MSEGTVLAVLDAHEPDSRPYIAWPPLMEWICEHGANPDHVRRVEVVLLDCPLVRFHEYDLEGENRVFAREDGTIAMKPPRDVLLKRMPPELPDHPLCGGDH